MLKTNLGRLRLLAILEGISYILLLGVCMPLKYAFDLPQFTYPVGMAHGLLFVLYCVWVLVVGLAQKWSFATIFLAGIASLLPLGTFVADAKIFKPRANEALAAAQSID
jgi:integral membrane protein